MSEHWDPAFEYEAIRPGEPAGSGDMPQSESIDLTSVWRMPSIESADHALGSGGTEFVYRRDGHPNESQLAKRLAKLHHGAKALVTAQGMSAISVVALSLLRPGAKVWLADELYGKSVQLFEKELSRWDVECQSFDVTDASHLEQVAQSAADLIMVETLSNPRLKMPDFAALQDVSQRAGAKLVVDNTFATHMLCRPIDFGADVVVESLGKQVNGHSDTMLGLIVAKEEELTDQFRSTSVTFGMASSPLDCYLTHRGLMTLALRLERACLNAMELAAMLQELPSVELVDYPGLTCHPQNALANRQLSGGFGWMLSVRLDANLEETQAAFDRLAPEIPFVPSLGDINTTLSHPASTSHRGLSSEDREALGITPGTIRVSCGVEPTKWLLDRFKSALNG